MGRLVYRIPSLNAQHIEPWSRWTTAAEDHTGCRSCQIRTGNRGYNSHNSHNVYFSNCKSLFHIVKKVTTHYRNVVTFFPLSLIFHFKFHGFELAFGSCHLNPDLFETKHMTDCDIPFPLHNVGVMPEVSLWSSMDVLPWKLFILRAHCGCQASNKEKQAVSQRTKLVAVR